MPEKSILKQIGNRIKAKGLQKIKWYCQMCAKQCRDENGFQCHLTGESHLRQMSLFRADPTKFMDQYSKDFETYFMEVMKRKGGMRVKANTVYQEVVADRQHVHMNSTKWETLGVFVQYLGKQGLCVVDQTEKGWYVTYIDRDPRVIARQEEIARRAEASLDAEERAAQAIRKQVEEAQKAEAEARAAGGDTAASLETAEPTAMLDRGEEEKIAFSLGGAASTAPAAAAAASSSATAAAASSSTAAALARPPAAPFSMSIGRPSVFNALAASSAAAAAASAPAAESAAPGGKRKGAPSSSSTLGALMAENERLKSHESALKKAKTDAAPPAAAAAAASSSAAAAAAAPPSSPDKWLFPNIVVRLLNKKLLDGKLYKAKGVVQRVVDTYLAEVRVLPSANTDADGVSGTVLRIDQDELETVLPAVGKLVRVVGGPYRGEVAVLLDLNEREYTAKIRIESGVLRGKEVDRVEYEAICKLHEG